MSQLGQFVPARILRRSTNPSGTNPAPPIKPGTSSSQCGSNLSPFGINYSKSGTNCPRSGTNCPSDSSDVLWLYNGIQFLMFIPIHNHASMMDCGTFWVLSRLQNQHGTNLERLGQIIPAGTNCPRLGQIVPAGTNCPRCKI